MIFISFQVSRNVIQLRNPSMQFRMQSAGYRDPTQKLVEAVEKNTNL